MYHEIERKFLVTKMPSLKGVEKVSQECYFIQRGDLLEEELKKKRSVCFYERKVLVSPIEKTREKMIVTEETFNTLKERGTNVIKRDSYKVSTRVPIISIKTYRETYKGLVIAEVKFNTIDEMEQFSPLQWMGAEITHTKLGKDSTLISLDEEHFRKELRIIEDAYNFVGFEGGYK